MENTIKDDQVYKTDQPQIKNKINNLFSLFNKKIFILTVAILLIFAVSLTVFLSTQKKLQDNRSHADLSQSAEDLTKIMLISDPNNPNLITVSTQRNAEMERISKIDPESFLLNAISPKIKERYPQSVKEKIEENVDLKGVIIDKVDDNDEQGTSTSTDSPSVIFQTYDSNGEINKSYNLYLREDDNPTPGSNYQVKGYLINGNIVPISIQEISSLTRVAKEIASGPQKAVLGVNTLGQNKRIAVIMTNFNQSGFRKNDFTKDELNTIYFTGPKSTINYLNKAAMGNLSFKGDINDIYEVELSNHNRASVCDIYETGRGAGFTKEAISKAKQQATQKGIDWTEYKFIGFIFPYAKGLCDGRNGEQNWNSAIARGIGNTDYNAKPYHFLNGNYCDHSVNCTNKDLNYYGGLMSHEMGHNLGLSHANGLDCGDKILSSYGNCKSLTYGDRFDLSGGAWTYQPNPSANNQNKYLNYMPDSNKITINKSNLKPNGIYTLYSSSKPRTNQIQFIRIPRPNTGGTYYIEYRSKNNEDANLPSQTFNGALVRLSEVPNNKIKDTFGAWQSRPAQTYLLDMANHPTKSSWANFINPAMKDNQLFTDNSNKINIKQISHDVNLGTVDLQISFGDPVCEESIPSLKITEPAQSGNSGETLNYEAKIINNNSGSCPPTEYNIIKTTPSGWTVQTPTSIKLNSGESRIFTAKITSPTSTNTSQNPFRTTLTVTDKNTPSNTKSRNVNYFILTSNASPTLIPSSIPTPTPTTSPITTSAPTINPTTNPGPASNIMRIIPVHDSYVSELYPTSNFGSSLTLWADGTPKKRFYLKFDLTTLANKNITNIKLQLTVSSIRYAASGGSFGVRFSDNNWSENTITWDNKPVPGDIRFALISDPTAGGTEIVDLTKQLLPKKGQITTITIGSDNANGSAYFSKESATGKPQLIIEYQ